MCISLEEIKWTKLGLGLFFVVILKQICMNLLIPGFPLVSHRIKSVCRIWRTARVTARTGFFFFFVFKFTEASQG